MHARAVIELVRASPKDAGVLKLIVLRPGRERRLTPPQADLSPGGGVSGDRWSLGEAPDPSAQVSVMNSRFLGAAGPGKMSLAGDNLIVDLDLGEENLPVGTRLSVGQAAIEVTSRPHKGCGKFERHYGRALRELVDSPEGRALRLRGLYARVVRPGTVRLEDVVRKEGAAA